MGLAMGLATDKDSFTVETDMDALMTLFSQVEGAIREKI